MLSDPRQVFGALLRLLGLVRRRLRFLMLMLALACLVPASSPSQPPAPSPLDGPMKLMSEAKQAYQNIRDYTCLFVKREQLRGQMMPEHVIDMKVRAQPFSVYLHWRLPKALENQEVCYVAGKNNGQMRVHSSGALGFIGWVSLDPNDPRAMENSRHTITEAGLGNLIEKYIGRYETEKKLNRTQVRMGEFEFNKRRCMRIETIHANSKPGDFYSYRAVIYLDKETKLPIRSEAYDWPRQGGPADGDLLECFSYVQMQFNTGLGDEAFNY